MSSSVRTVFQNNFFAATFDAVSCGLDLYHNNFGDNSLFQYATGGEIVNNNICRFTGYCRPGVFFNNNFTSNDAHTLKCSCFDPSPSYYNPEYNSSKDLHINNPALFSRAKYLGVITEDIDNEPRDSSRSIGADETCLKIPFPDTIFIECGSKYILKICQPDSTNIRLYWKPGKELIDSLAYMPTTIADCTKLLWLEDSIGSVIDSVFIVPIPIKSIGKQTYNTHAGWPISLACYVPIGSSITWSPDSLVDYPDSSIVEVTTCESIQFIVTIDNGDCGIIVDTVDLIIDPTPNAYFTWDSIDCLDAYLSMYYPCYDSVLWDFDDGTFSTQTSGWHSFPNNGTYMVTLTVWHEGYTDSRTSPIIINCVGISEIIKDGILIYPNPTNNILIVNIQSDRIKGTYKIMDIAGRVLLEGAINEKQLEIDVSKLSKGMYLLKLEKYSLRFIKN